MTSWTVYENKRNRGGPKIRWEDKIINRVGILWKRLAANRTVWKKFGKDYDQVDVEFDTSSLIRLQ